MNTLKIVLLVIAIIVAVPLVVALFVKKEYGLERSVVIDRPAPAVFDYIKYLSNQNSYIKWAQIDPEMKKIFKGTDATVGFISRWESDNKNVGVGEQEIVAINEQQGRIDYELRFFKPFESTSHSYMSVEPVSDTQSKVRWGMKGRMPYPLNLMLLMMNMEKTIGTDFDEGLNSLKRIMEKPQAQ